MNLSEARSLLTLSQSELARRAGVDVRYVNQLEAGLIQHPSHQKVTLIVRALQRSGLPGITAESLFPVEGPAEVAS